MKTQEPTRFAKWLNDKSVIVFSSVIIAVAAIISFVAMCGLGYWP